MGVGVPRDGSSRNSRGCQSCSGTTLGHHRSLKSVGNCRITMMLNSPSFPLGATLHFLWPHWLSLDAFWVDGTWGGGGELVHPWHVLGTRSPQEDSHCCFHATAVASDTQGLAWPGWGLDCFSPMAGAQGQHWLFSPVASQHSCCPGNYPGPWCPISGECPRWTQGQVWACRAPGCRVFQEPLTSLHLLPEGSAGCGAAVIGDRISRTGRGEGLGSETC